MCIFVCSSPWLCYCMLLVLLAGKTFCLCLVYSICVVSFNIETGNQHKVCFRLSLSFWNSHLAMLFSRLVMRGNSCTVKGKISLKTGFQNLVGRISRVGKAASASSLFRCGWYKTEGKVYDMLGFFWYQIKLLLVLSSFETILILTYFPLN